MSNMPDKHYDVVVLGRSIGALTAAALLARRDFTVLVLGQGDRPQTYRHEQRALRRRAFTLLTESSPAWRRVLAELAQSQTWKRRLVPAAPMMQVVTRARRVDVPPDMALLYREVEREFPEVRRVVDELYTDLARVNGAADDAFERDAIWPPGTFWERRETNRYAATLPYVRAEPDADLLLEFPRGHAWRQIVGASVLFATDLSSMPPPFAVARLHGAWTRGVSILPGGEDELEEFLVGRIEAHGGQCQLADRAASLHVRRGVAAGVVLDGDDRPLGADFVITDMDGESVARLAGGEGIHKRAQREWPRITSSVGRFTVSMVVRREALPAPLGPEVFFFPARGADASRGGAGARPMVHLQRTDVSVEPTPQRSDDEVLLVAEALLPDRGAWQLGEARAAVLETITQELPFFERHLCLVDSVHDGLPVWVYEGGRRRAVDRASLKGASATPEPMLRNLEIDPPGYLGLAGEPIRGPVERTLLVGRTVLPGLGQEGQLLAAWGAARLVTRTDKRKERMRRDMWSKVEIG
jgi:phytoene dehydrogenase-like protein